MDVFVLFVMFCVVCHVLCCCSQCFVLFVMFSVVCFVLFAMCCLFKFVMFSCKDREVEGRIRQSGGNHQPKWP